MEEKPPQDLLFRDQDFSSELLKQLNVLRQNRILTDVILCTSDIEISCHRNVLASSSPYFKAMFCNNFKESHQEKVSLRGIDSDILQCIITYVYTGEILITAENVLYLMETASMLQYARLFEASSAYLQDQLTPNNCLSLIRLSENLHCENLNKKAKAMALKCFPEVATSEDLKELCALELLNYLGDDELCGEEEQVFEAVMAWVRHDVQARQDYIQDLFKKVYHVTRNMWFRMETRVVKNVCAPAAVIGDRIFIVGGYTRRVIAYDTRTNKFVKCADMKDRRMHHGVAVISEKLFLTGGRCLTTDNAIEDSDSLECYDPKTDSWASKGKLPHKMFDHGCLALQCVPQSNLVWEGD